MAKLDEYWSQITKSDSFQDLDQAQKEKIRMRLFETYVQKNPSYQKLPVSKRNQVLEHYNSVTQIQPDTMIDTLERKGKKIAKAVAPAVQGVKKAVSGIPGDITGGITKAADVEGKVLGKVAGSNIGRTAELGQTVLEETAKKIEPYPMKKGYELLEKGAGAIGKASEKAGAAMEPNFDKPKLTNFDLARAIGSGAVRTVGSLIEGFIPTSPVQAGEFLAADGLFKVAGSTFLGADMSAGWKPKTGIAESATSLGDGWEKMVTKQRMEASGRQVLAGPPKPLEVLANKEAEIAAQKESDGYEQWLKERDSASPQGGSSEGPGDLHPDMKVNVSQLRDAAKERLRKLQNEPVRVESLSKAGDLLHGYYRRRTDGLRVYLMPQGPEAPLSLPPGPKSSGLLEGPESEGGLPTGEKEPVSPSPEPSKTQLPPPKPETRKPIPSVTETSTKAQDIVSKMYQEYYPNETIQANKIRAGAMLKALDIKPGDVLKPEHIEMFKASIDSEHGDTLLRGNRDLRDSMNPEVLRQKGIDIEEVKSVAKRLKEEHEFARQQILEIKRSLRDAIGGGVGPHDPDPMTGRIPEHEEYIQAIPRDMRGSVRSDIAAQRAYDAGIIGGPSSNDLYEYTRRMETAGRARPVKGFDDDAVREIEGRLNRDAGFVNDAPKFGQKAGKPVQQGLLPEENLQLGSAKAEGAPPVEGSGEQTNIPGTEAKFEPKPLLPAKDVKQQTAFELTTDIWKGMGEKGGIGGEIDPAKQAAMEAAMKELVDRAMTMGYKTTQDILLYAARNAPEELQDAMRKNLHPTLSPFDTHAYKEMDEARKGNPVAKKSMMDAAKRGYFQDKLDMAKGRYKQFKANQQIALFKDMDEGLMKLKNDLFLHDYYRKFSKDELAAQRWYTEGKSPKLESLTALNVPEETAKRWLELAKNPTEIMKKAKAATQTMEDAYHSVLSDYYDSMGYREDHVTRRWKRPEQYLDWEGKMLGGKPNFTKGAKLLSQAQGIDAGLEPESFDIRDDLKASNNSRVNTLSRIHAYQKLGASVGPDGMPAMIDVSPEGSPSQARNAKLTPHRGEAPPSWYRPQGVPLLDGIAVHPYYKQSLQYLLARPFQGSAVEMMDLFAATTKASKLIGLFHGFNLGEMTLSGVSYRDVFSFNKNRNVMVKMLRYYTKAATADMEGEAFSKNPIKGINQLYKSFMSGNGVLANRPLALDMAEANFKFGAADGEMYNVLSRTLKKIETKLATKIGDNPAKALTVLPRLAVDLTNKAIFAYMRPISSMIVYENNLADAIEKFNILAPEGKKMPIDQIKQAVVNQTSKEMGGIAWSRMMVHPKTQQILQWAMLAPEWKAGRALMGLSVFQGGPEGRQARKQMTKLFIGYYMLGNMANYAQTKKYLGKGRMMWDNPPGHKDQIFINKNSKGELYAQGSKGLSDIHEDMTHPFRTLAYSESPGMQAAGKMMDWAKEKVYYPGSKPETPLQAIGEAYQPMFSSGNSLYGAIPVHRGPSKNQIEGMIDQWHQGGMKDTALLNQAIQMSTENGYDFEKLEREVRSSRTHKMREDLFR